MARDRGLIEQYSKIMEEYPPLSDGEQRALFHRAKLGDARAREKLIYSNLRLISVAMRKTPGIRGSEDDLFSEGVIGLIQAVNWYDPTRGFTFSTYAVKAIRMRLIEFVNEESGAFKQTATYNQLIGIIEQAGNGMSYAQIAGLVNQQTNSTHYQPEDIAKLVKIRTRFSSLDRVLSEGENRNRTLADTVQDDSQDSSEISLHKEYLEKRIGAAFSRLRADVQKCFMARFYERKTFKQISEETGLPSKTVQRRVEIGLKLLRKHLRDLCP